MGASSSAMRIRRFVVIAVHPSTDCSPSSRKKGAAEANCALAVRSCPRGDARVRLESFLASVPLPCEEAEDAAMRGRFLHWLQQPGINTAPTQNNLRALFRTTSEVSIPNRPRLRVFSTTQVQLWQAHTLYLPPYDTTSGPAQEKPQRPLSPADNTQPACT